MNEGDERRRYINTESTKKEIMTLATHRTNGREKRTWLFKRQNTGQNKYSTADDHRMMMLIKIKQRLR